VVKEIRYVPVDGVPKTCLLLASSKFPPLLLLGDGNVPRIVGGTSVAHHFDKVLPGLRLETSVGCAFGFLVKPLNKAIWPNTPRPPNAVVAEAIEYELGGVVPAGVVIQQGCYSRPS
jgi:hypothetical protein